MVSCKAGSRQITATYVKFVLLSCVLTTARACREDCTTIKPCLVSGAQEMLVSSRFISNNFFPSGTRDSVYRSHCQYAFTLQATHGRFQKKRKRPTKKHRKNYQTRSKKQARTTGSKTGPRLSKATKRAPGKRA